MGINKRILVGMIGAVFIVFIASSSLYSYAKSPEDAVALFCKGWKKQNIAYMLTVSGMESFSSYGDRLSDKMLRKYEIVSKEKYYSHLIVKVKLELLTAERGLHSIKMYFVLKRIDGVWLIVNGSESKKLMKTMYNK